MAELKPGAEVAKDLGVYLGQLYGWVKSGKLKNYKEDGKYVVEGGKGLIVDPDEARTIWMTSKKKGPRDPSKPRKGKVRNEDGTVSEAPRVRRLKTGQVVSFENGRRTNGSAAPAKARVTIAQVLGANGRLTFLDDGDHRRHYNGTVIDDMFFSTERLSTLLTKGVAHVEHPIPLLGMVILAFITEGKLELAESLEKWMTKNDLEVIVPEPVEMEDDEEPEPTRGKPVALEEDEETD